MENRECPDCGRMMESRQNNFSLKGSTAKYYWHCSYCGNDWIPTTFEDIKELMDAD